MELVLSVAVIDFYSLRSQAVFDTWHKHHLERPCGVYLSSSENVCALGEKLFTHLPALSGADRHFKGMKLSLQDQT